MCMSSVALCLGERTIGMFAAAAAALLAPCLCVCCQKLILQHNNGHTKRTVNIPALVQFMFTITHSTLLIGARECVA
jgi:hypothetical protein